MYYTGKVVGNRQALYRKRILETVCFLSIMVEQYIFRGEKVFQFGIRMKRKKKV